MASRIPVESFLSMPGIADQVHGRGSLGASYGQSASTGLSQAKLGLFERLQETWNTRPIDQTYLAELDQLQPQSIIRLVCDRLRGLAELADPGPDPAEIRKATGHLLSVRSKVVSRVGREAQLTGDQTVVDAFAKVNRSLTTAIASAPAQARAIATSVKRTIQSLSFPTPDGEAQAKLLKCLKAIEQLQARPGTLPMTTFDFAVSRLAGAAQAAHADTLVALAGELAEGEFRRQIPRLLAYLDELVVRTNECSAKLGKVRAELEQRFQRESRQRHVSRASVVLLLPGQSEAEVLSGMMAQAGVADANGLAERLLDAFEGRIREQAPKLCPHLDAVNAPLSELVRGADVERLTNLFSRLIDEFTGPGSTIYEAMQRVGLEKIAAFLYQRAAPTIDLADRDVEQFNVSPLLLTVVRLPAADGANDPELRDQLRVAFEQLDQCTFTDGAEGDQVVTVIRAHIGWPIGIESSNRALLDRYVRAGERGHRPHLVGILPDAFGGAISPAMQNMALAKTDITLPQQSSPVEESL